MSGRPDRCTPKIWSRFQRPIHQPLEGGASCRGASAARGFRTPRALDGSEPNFLPGGATAGDCDDDGSLVLDWLEPLPLEAVLRGSGSCWGIVWPYNLGETAKRGWSWLRLEQDKHQKHQYDHIDLHDRELGATVGERVKTINCTERGGAGEESLGTRLASLCQVDQER